VEPTKKSYFNVTIKSNNHHNVTNTSSSSSLTNNNNSKITSTAHRQSNTALLSSDKEIFTNKLSAPSKVYVPEREPAPAKQTFFQGISDWSERKESPPRPLKPSPLSTKAFQEELSNTLERKQRTIKLQGTQNEFRHPLNGIKEEPKPMKFRSSSREDLLRSQKEDLGYLSGSRTDLRAARKYSNDDYAVPMKKKTTNGFLHREDSGFRDSKEDLRSPPQREDSFGHDDVKQASIQRDDSAYVSSSTYFTTPRSPRRPRSPVMKTPDSGIRSPTPTNDFESDELHQSPPAVPQRKKAVERKVRAPTKNEDYANYPAKPRRDPPIDYSPPPRSRSVSPLPPIHHVYSDRKSYQKTRFSSPPSTPTIPRSTQTAPPPKKKTVGNAIGNSLRKLVGKIRSVSAERKLKAKTSSSKRSPSPIMTRHRSVSNLPSSSSYQRNEYIIDGHISANGHHNGYKNRPPSTSTQGKPLSLCSSS
jgi:hypothetical protein